MIMMMMKVEDEASFENWYSAFNLLFKAGRNFFKGPDEIGLYLPTYLSFDATQMLAKLITHIGD